MRSSSSNAVLAAATGLRRSLCSRSDEFEFLRFTHDGSSLETDEHSAEVVLQAPCDCSTQSTS